MTMFTYDEYYEDLDGQEKAMLPAGTIAFLQPKMGETVYAQVTFYSKGGFKSYAEKIVPRFVGSERDNAAEVQVFSRPVPYPYDWDSWLIANINDEPVPQTDSPESISTHTGQTEPLAETELKAEDEINAMTKKADVIAYAESIGLNGLDTEQKLDDLKAQVLNYQGEKYDL